ncbi:MAG: 3-sulfinopropanoyl-CoA desulfinase [Pseudomonadota bacterium]
MFELDADQLALQARAREVAEGDIAARAARVDATEEYPWDNIETLRDAGFMGMTIPKAYGGQARSYLDAVLVIEQMAMACGVSGRIVVEANMGAVGAIMRYGNEAQKKLAAALVLAGDKPAICITEPDAGSAATEMTTRADRRGDGYVLNGKKHWITGGGVSKLHLIFARVFDDGIEQGIGGFLAIRDESEGLRIGAREPAMGLRGIPEAEVFFDDLVVPTEMMIVPPEGLRRGFAGLMNAYNGQRVGAGTVALGVASGAYEEALEYVQTREQFGRPICEFQGLQWMLVDMDTQLNAARNLIYQAAASGGTGFPDITKAARAKIFASEMAIKVTNDALQMFGAAGYSRRLPMERMVRDARMFTIGGGTAQILRTVVATQILSRKLPQTRDGYLNQPHRPTAVAAGDD